MKVLHTIYNNTDIEFYKKDEILMLNATQMAQVFGKDLFQFTKSDHARSFIAECLKPANAGLLGIKNSEDLIISKQKSGTWMHRVLALKFAAWLSPEFELWVYTTIDKILTGHFKEQEEAIKQKLQAEEKLEKKKQELLEKYPDFVEFLDLQEEIKQANKKRVKAVKQKVKQLQLELFPNK